MWRNLLKKAYIFLPTAYYAVILTQTFNISQTTICIYLALQSNFMKPLSLLILLLSVTTLNAQTIDDYFNKIRNNSAQLEAFFSQMPKGGDLHNHYSGSVYAETYIDDVVQKNYYINTNTL